MDVAASDGERDGRAGRAGLRRHHGRAGGRGAGGAAARVPAVGALLGRGHARARRRRPAHVRARPARLLAGRPPGRPRRLPDGRAGRRRRGGRRGGTGARPGGRARTSSGTTGARSSPGRSPGPGPSSSAPSPGSPCRRRAPWPTRCAGPASSARRGTWRRSPCPGWPSGCSPSRAGSVVVAAAGPRARPVRPDPRARRARRRRPRRPGRAHRGAELVPGDPALAAAMPSRRRPHPRCSSGATATPP